MNGWGGEGGIDPERVAELLVTPAQPGPGRRGSGYRVSASTVLTAAHVVRDAARVQVRFNADRPGEWLAEASVDWLDSGVDAAVVTFPDRPQDEGPMAPVRFGRVAERDAVLACSAMGFPRFKLRDDAAQPQEDGQPSRYRDSAHAVGTIAVLSNRREGTLEVSVAPPERDPDPDRSPWEGMSGAAVWSSGRIIGLVAEHHRADGLGRLAASRVDRWYERLLPDQLGQLRRLLPGLPASPADLGVVGPGAPGDRVQAGYAAQVRDIAPDELRGRDEELAELVQFCAGEDRYQWWHARAWAGKSALAAWFVLHPPAGVTAVSFFVTGRLPGQADSSAFTEAMIDQLAALTGETVAVTTTPAGRDRERRRLLELAAQRASEHQQRLVLVVDGLDEDEGAGAGSRVPSIASLLPRHPPDAVRILVTSRPHPGTPGDVPADHPLRHCRQRELAPSSFAQDVKIEAERELREQLHGEPLEADLIGFITASGGGLTARDLGELTQQPRWAVTGKLDSVFGRSLQAWTQQDGPPGDEGDRVYLFGHEALRAIAEHELADDLGPYQRGIDAWADSYCAQHWPDNTPHYLLQPYAHRLGTSETLDRLLSFAVDTARHGRLLTETYSDVAALAEISAARGLVLARPSPDLAALGRLAVAQDRLAIRNRAVPAALPALWMRLGHRRRAEAVARSIPDLPLRARALAAVARELAAVDRERALSLFADAEQAGRSIPAPDDRAGALAAVARELAAVDPQRALGLFADAEQAGRSIPAPDDRAGALAAVARELAAVDPERARRLFADAEQATTSLVGYIKFETPMLLAVVQALAVAGKWDRAEQAARTISDSPLKQAAALAVVARELAALDRERAVALAAEAERTVGLLPSFTGLQAQALLPVAETLAVLKEWDRAEQVARTIASPADQAEALAVVGRELAAVNRERALALAADAQQIARTTLEYVNQDELLYNIVVGLAGAGLWDAADQTARLISHPAPRTWALQALAEGLASAGQWDRAEQTARLLADPEVRAQRATSLARLAKELAAADRERALALFADAEQDARDSPYGADRAAALTVVATELAAVDRERARTLADDAQQMARTISDTAEQAQVLHTTVEGLAAAGHWDHAERTARTIPDPGGRAQALGLLARELAAAGRGPDAAGERLEAEAHRLLAELLAGQYWPAALQPLGLLQPLALVAIRDMLCAPAPD
jgi:Trypsin-like peptidase domain